MHRFQETLGKTIHSRKEPHVTHEELVQVTKWKLIRGKNRPRLLDLVRINTELAVSQATKKAFKKVSKDLNSAISALTNLKGIGPQTASAVLCAGYPEHCPFMADEAMLATPGVEASDYTHAEFVNFATQIKSCTDKLKELDPETKWTPHKVELTLWTHAIAKDLKPAILSAMPLPDGSPREVMVDDEVTSPSASATTDTSSVAVNGSNGNGKLHNGSNGSAAPLDEDSNISGPASVSGDEKSNDGSSSASTPGQGEGDDSSQSVEFRTPHQLSSPVHHVNSSSNGNTLTQQHAMTQHNSVTTVSNGSNSSNCSSTNATNGSNSNHGNGNSLGSGEESLEGDNSRNVPTLFSAESNGDASNLSSIIDEASASSIASLGTNTGDSTSIPDSVTSKVALTSSTAGDLASHEPALKKIRAE